MNYKKNINECKIERIETKVKWYNPEKGYGFLIQEDNPEDIMIHFSVLDAVGYPYVKEGDQIICDIYIGKTGWQVSRVTEVKLGSPGPRSLSAFLEPQAISVDPEGLEEIQGAIKWYNSKKGFGFIYPDDGRREVFLHTSVLRMAGYKYLEPGVRVSVKIANTEKGQEARILRVLYEEEENFTAP